jgi:hypothetical protein
METPAADRGWSSPDPGGSSDASQRRAARTRLAACATARYGGVTPLPGGPSASSSLPVRGRWAGVGPSVRSQEGQPSRASRRGQDQTPDPRDQAGVSDPDLPPWNL